MLSNTGSNNKESSVPGSSNDQLPEALRDYDPELVHKISSEIVHRGQQVTFNDISGLDFAKKCVTELICWYVHPSNCLSIDDDDMG